MSFSSNFPTVMPSLLLDFANTKALDPRVTFTRASTATFYDGVTVAKAEENLLLQSQAFENASWTKSRITVTADSTAAPDGTTTADAIYETADNNTHLCVQNITAGSVPYSLSVYAKNGLGRDWMYLRLIRDNAGAPAASLAYFNITSGTVGSTGTDLTASIVSVGNGWYRCTATVTKSISTQSWGVGIASADGTDSYAGDITKGVYLWGAQLEQRSAATAYTATTTQPITNYIPVLRTASAGVARFDHNPTTGQSLGLLIEEQRANLVTYSDDFSNAAWAKSDCTIVSNAGIAPDGTLTADRLIPNNATNLGRTFQTIAGSIGTTYTTSIYAKKDQFTNLRLYVDDNATNLVSVSYNLDTGAVSTPLAINGGNWTNASSSIVAVGNGWWRASLTFTATNVAPTRWQYWCRDVGNAFSGIYIWGAQVEAGSFATSYIPTVASSVTRSADAASMTGTNFSSWYRADEGTAYVEAIPSTQALTQLLVDFNDGGINNRWRIFRADITGACSFSVNALGSAQVSAITSGTFTQNATTKAAATYKTNDFALSGNAATVATDTSGIVPVVNVLRIAAQFDGAGVLNGTIRKIAYYPLRLTNTQLQALTS